MKQDDLERKRWWIAAAAVAMQLCLGTVYAWSIFKKPMMSSHGWTETQTQGAFMIYSFVFALSVAFGGMLVDRKGPRLVGAIGGMLFGGGLLLAGLANSLAHIGLLYLAYGFIAGLGGGFGYVAPLTALIRWFPDKRGLVTGLAVMGYGFGSFIMGNVGPRLIIKLGVADTFLIWGVCSLFLVLSAVLLLRNPPEQWTPVGQGHGAGSAFSSTPSFSFFQAARTPQFWMLWLILFLNVSAGLGLISQLSPMAQDVMRAATGGMISEDRMKTIVILSGSIVAVAAIFNGIGRLAWAWISDAIGRKAVFAVLCSTQAAGYLLLAHTSKTIMFAALVCYLLACYGGALASLPAFAADEFGPQHIGKIYGVIFTACALAGIVGPYLFAHMKEIADSYKAALYIESGFLAAGFVLAITFRKPRPIA